MLLILVAAMAAVVFLVLLTLGLCRNAAEHDRFVEAYIAQRRPQRRLPERQPRPTRRAA